MDGEEDDQRQRERQVHVTGGRGEEAGVAARDEGDPVADEDEQSDRDTETHEGQSLGPDRRLGEIGHLLDYGLPEELQLAGHARRRLGAHAQSEPQHDGRRDQCRPHDVEVDGQPRDVHDAVVIADRDRAAGQDEVLWVHWIPWDMTTRPTLTTKRSWKITRPATAPMPRAPFKRRRPMQTNVMIPEASHALGTHRAAEHLVAHLALGVQLGHAGIEEPQVHHGHA